MYQNVSEIHFDSMAEMIPIYYLTVEIVFIPAQTLSALSLSHVCPNTSSTPSLHVISHILSSTPSLISLSR